MRYLLIILLLLFSFYLKSQDTLLLLSGKRFHGTALDTTGLKINFNIDRPGKSSKQKSFYRDQVFSITNENGDESIYYFPDMFFVNEYTIENMRFEIFGKIDARNGYKTKWVYPVGITAGFLAGFFSKGSALSAIIPVAYIGVVQIPFVKVQPKSISNPGFIGNEFYKSGYNQKARMKRTRDAIISGFAGLIAGIVIYDVTK
jgi:hypothetical protein